MTVLVTGAQGLAGRYLIAAWLEKDPSIRLIGIGRSPEYGDVFTHSITWFERKVPAPLPRVLRSTFEADRYVYHRLDLIKTDDLAALISDEGIDLIVHLATSLRDEPFECLVRNNLQATQSLFEALARSGRTGVRIIVGSSGSVYGQVADTLLPVNESLHPAPIDLYALTKRAAEDVALIYRRKHDLTIVVARIFNMVGAGQEERHLCGHLARQFSECNASNTPKRISVGPLDTTRDFVDVRDVARALILLATHPNVAGIYNVGSGVETATQEVFNVLAELSGQTDDTVNYVPARPDGFARQYADISRLRDLGFCVCYELRDSLTDVLYYYLHDVAAAAEG